MRFCVIVSKKEVKMYLQNWFNIVKTAVQDGITLRRFHKKYMNAYNKISLLESDYEIKNEYIQNRLGTEFCEIEYEDGLGENSVFCRCAYFNADRKCENKNCQILNANHEYFDARAAYHNAKKQTNSKER